MLKVKVTRETMVKAIEYHAFEGYSLSPVLDDDADVCDWARWVLGDVIPCDAVKLDAAGLVVTVNGADVVIGVQAVALGAEVLDAVRRHLLIG